MIQSPGDFDASRYKPIDERELNVRNRPFRDRIADHVRRIGQRVIVQSLASPHVAATDDYRQKFLNRSGASSV